jgi:UDP-N-acetylglucosamine--N-acetylmuramyl-(pentapeptide) pyrophosphoryl-undecaprenol N-acetylglucosamine transferase
VGQTARHIVWYAHDRAGALARARAVRPHLESRATVLARLSTPGLDPSAAGLVVLGDDPSGDPLQLLVDQVATLGPGLVVIDGGVDPWDAAARLSVPVVGVRRPTWAPPGSAATAHPAAWLAPFPAVLDAGDLGPELSARTLHAGFLSPYVGSRLTRGAARRRLDLDAHGRHVTILAGRAGLGVDRPTVLAAAARTRGWTFSVLGACEGSDEPGDRVDFLPWTSDVFPHLVAADAVVGAASPSLVADIAAARRPFAVIARDEQGDEEGSFATNLERSGAAVALPSWPPAVAWPALLAEVLDLSLRPLRRLEDGRGPRRAAAWLDELVAGAPADSGARSGLAATGDR